MNILFYLVPKSSLVYIYDDDSLQETMEKMERYRYTAVPVITKKGQYVGSLTEGDLLWFLKEAQVSGVEDLGNISVRQIKRRKDNQPVNINCNMEDLVMTAMNQNFIPVIDDNRTFIGIVTRKSVISYCFEGYKKQKVIAGRKSEKDPVIHG